MKNLKVGERVVLNIVVTETATCEGCFFESKLQEKAYKSWIAKKVL